MNKYTSFVWTGQIQWVNTLNTQKYYLSSVFGDEWLFDQNIWMINIWQTHQKERSIDDFHLYSVSTTYEFKSDSSTQSILSTTIINIPFISSLGFYFYALLSKNDRNHCRHGDGDLRTFDILANCDAANIAHRKIKLSKSKSFIIDPIFNIFTLPVQTLNVLDETLPFHLHESYVNVLSVNPIFFLQIVADALLGCNAYYVIES